MLPAAGPIGRLVFLFWLCSAGALSAFDLDWRTDGISADGLLPATLLGALASEGTTDGQDVLSAAQADYARLTSALYEAGYFGPVISIRLDGREAADISPVRVPAVVGRVTIAVAAGPQFRLGRAEIAPLAPKTELPDGFRSGGPASTSLLRSTARTATDAWRDVGHAQATVAGQQITARHGQQVLDVDIALDPGPRLRFGPLQISGETNVRHDRIRAIAGLPEGQVFSPAELDRARNRLQRTGTFRVAALSEAEAITQPDLLPIDAEIADRLPRRFGFGAELSSLQGLTLSGYWLHRNIFGGAERLRFDAEIGGIAGEDGGTDYEASVRFDKPAARGADTDYFGLFEIAALDEVGFSSNRVALTGGFINRKTPRRTYQYALGIEHAQTDDAFGERDYTILTLPLSAEFDYREPDEDARRGYFALLELTPFYAVSGTDSGVRALLDARAYRPAGDRVTLAARAQIGTVFGPALDDAPADYLFYSGGGGTVRGQPYQSLGVELPNDLLAGGRSFLGLSAEMRVRTGDNLSVVAFADAGYIGEETFPDGSGEWHSGAGFGVRYDTGVGPLRFDVAVPVDGPGENDGFEIYIGIGQAF